MRAFIHRTLGEVFYCYLVVVLLLEDISKKKIHIVEL